MSLWGGRFEQGLDPAFESFNRSLPFDYRLWREDIEGSRAWVAAQEQAGSLEPAEAKKLDRALGKLERQLLADTSALHESDAEDIHSFVEAWLVEELGDLGKKLHAGRSRNDQVATDMRLHVKRRLDATAGAVTRLMAALAELAEREHATPLPGYTHLQRAQIVTVGHHLLAYVEMLDRDLERIRGARDRLDRCPLGSGALAGTGLPVDRTAISQQLGFKAPTRNSIDAVSDRDFIAEVLFVATLSGAHLSRLCEDWIFYTSQEAGFLRLSDQVTTGSSLMPQKKNPDSLELVRGKGARLLGRLGGFLACLRSLPLAYNKDLQEDKEALFESLDTWDACLDVMTTVVAGAEFDGERCEAACRSGYLNATELADYLVARGVPFREAHDQVGRLVRLGLSLGLELHELDLEQLREHAPACDAGVFDALDTRRLASRRKALGAANPSLVRREARRWIKRLAPSSNR